MPVQYLYPRTPFLAGQDAIQFLTELSASIQETSDSWKSYSDAIVKAWSAWAWGLSHEGCSCCQNCLVAQMCLGTFGGSGSSSS